MIQSIQASLYRQGIQVGPIAPNSWAGRSNQVSYGMRLKATVTLLPAQDGFFVDLRVGSDIESNGIIVLIVLWFVFFPAALVIGLLGYQDVTAKQTQLCQAVWAPLAGRIVPANVAYPPQQIAMPGVGYPPGGPPPGPGP